MKPLINNWKILLENWQENGFFPKMASPANEAPKANSLPSEIAVLTEKFEENMEILQSKFRNSVMNAKWKQDLGKR